MTFPDIKPNYEHSILNLTSTLAEKMGVQLEPEGLTEEALTEIDESTTILFLVLDGLGSNYLMKHGSGLWMHEHVVDSISSVFPPSTGSAMTTFYTGASPLQHGVTGWFVYLKEVGVVSRFLPFTTLVNDEPMGLDVSTFIGAENWLKKVKRSIFLGPDRIIDSPYSRFASRGCLRIGYKNMKHLFGEMRDRACNFHGQQFIFAYYPEIDAIAHDEGIESEAALKQVTKLDKNLEKLAKEIPSNARIIITADHGLVDIKQENTVRMGDHPELKKMLIAPVCGDT
ncbi:MAG: alkaline phosphatase family protein, partial [Promethearchaeia archaeon]